MWVYRLVKARHAASPLEGFGAKTYGGRWNSPGDAWVASGASLALLVPSVLVPQQRNILINPADPDVPTAAGSARAEPFDFDPRLAR